jgi:N-acetylglucosaminyldiphosphoundecaprenol N-acetyl-beta-D-mannosaminyltransferase
MARRTSQKYRNAVIPVDSLGGQLTILMAGESSPSAAPLPAAEESMGGQAARPDGNRRAEMSAVGHSSPDDLLARAELPSFPMLGVRVHAVQTPDAVERLCAWIDAPQAITRYVAVAAMHTLAECRKNDDFRTVLNMADLVVPDGMPLVWVGRLKGFPLRHRVCGSELMDGFCRATGSTYRHFFFGGNAGVAETLASMLHQRYGIVVAGTYTPPFRALTETEERDFATAVDKASPDVLWVGLSSPNQERWLYEHRDKLSVPVMLGVGAAFDLNSGKLRRAPEWMRENGLEWLFRLLSEPRRLWKRYLVTIPEAAWFVCLELLFPQSRTALPQPGSNSKSKRFPEALSGS